CRFTASSSHYVSERLLRNENLISCRSISGHPSTTLRVRNQQLPLAERSRSQTLPIYESASYLILVPNPFSEGANLDILAELYDAAGLFVAGSNPIGSLAANLSGSFSSGDYFLSVTGTGEGNASSGYSGYASLGQYSITGTVA
ncbi:MAG: hypothetical protein DCF25_03235, partial [Leptolyngbya foveolarum]